MCFLNLHSVSFTRLGKFSAVLSFFLIVFVSGVQVFPGSYGKESAYNAEDLGSVLGSGRSSEEGNGVKQSESVILPYRPLQRIEQVLKSYRLYI